MPLKGSHFNSRECNSQKGVTQHFSLKCRYLVAVCGVFWCPRIAFGAIQI